MGENARYTVLLFILRGHGERYVCRLLDKARIQYSVVDIGTIEGMATAHGYDVYSAPYAIKLDEDGNVAVRANGIPDIMRNIDSLKVSRRKWSRK